jgi:hypothetical protein
VSAPWHALLAPLPDTSVVERKPVASAELIAAGTAGPIAGWESLSVNLSDPPAGLRHVLVTIDADGALLSASDWVLHHRREHRDGADVAVYDHHSIGGRFEPDGSFRGTTWRSQSEQRGLEEDDSVVTSSVPSAPTPEEISGLRQIVADVMRRAPAGRR